MTHVPLGILIGNRKVQPVGIVRTVRAIALGDVTSEEPRLAIRFAQESTIHVTHLCTTVLAVNTYEMEKNALNTMGTHNNT